MKELVLEAKKDTLGVYCSKGEMTLEGNSILPDPRKFFKPVNDWLDEYLTGSPVNTVITLKFNHIDTASVQSIFDLLKKFKDHPEHASVLTVNWYFEFDDPELLEVGEIMEGRLKLNFNYIEYSN